MIDDSVENFIAALENSTRRGILKRLIFDESYALEISRWIGVSQQAINKQLELLERAKLISSVGTVPSNSGAPRKVYRPTGFSTLVIDYSRSFFEVKRVNIDYDEESNPQRLSDNKELFDELSKVNVSIDKLMKERTELVKKKDAVISILHQRIADLPYENLTKNLLIDYLETLDIRKVSEKSGIPAEIVADIVNRFIEL